MRKKSKSNKKPFYPVNSPNITKKDIDSVNQVLKSGPNSSYLARYGLYLPSYFKLKKKDIDYISSVINKFLL